MSFAVHGDYKIELSGEIFIMSFFQNWNIECAKSFFSDYKAIVKKSGLKKFAVLSDLSQFKGGTPDAIDFFETISDWAQVNGQEARAVILDTALKMYTVSRVDKGKSRFPVQIVTCKEEAFAWFESLGISPSNNSILQ